MANQGTTKLFTFSDFFAGIGGIRIAFESFGGRCVFSSEYDKFSQRTYEAFFGERPDFADKLDVDPPGDITKLTAKDPGIPGKHDILTGGFPCQPFSLAGVSKKQSLDRPHGFDDPTQGTLFFDLKEIINAVRPKAFLLENVKNLRSHDGGNTYEIIRKTLQDECGYEIFDRVIDAKYWVPQHRERIFIVGFRKKTGRQKWSITEFEELKSLEPDTRLFELENLLLPSPVDSKYTLGPGTWRTLERHKAHHEAAGNGFGYGLIKKPYRNKVTRTLSARYHKDGAEILINQPGRKRPRRLTPIECGRLMGFPEKLLKFFDPSDTSRKQPVSDTQAYRQFGNSVVVPVVRSIAELMVSKMVKAGALKK